jgi:hypothetical protein
MKAPGLQSIPIPPPNWSRLLVHHLPVQHRWAISLGDLPTWLAAIGTVGALIVAFIQIGTERRLRHERELKEQARLIAAITGPAVNEDEAKAEAERGRRGWIGAASAGTARTAIDLINGSLEPVYRIVLGVVYVQGTSPRTMEEWLKRGLSQQPITTVSVLPSGTYRVWISGYWLDAGGGGMGGRSAAEVAFTDRAGKHWIRRATGQLEELPEDPIEHFGRLGLHRPYDLQTAERL